MNRRQSGFVVIGGIFFIYGAALVATAALVGHDSYMSEAGSQNGDASIQASQSEVN